MISPNPNTMSQSLGANEPLPSLDLTALIDIIFIVLVFLLLTANSQLLSLPVDVPQTHSTINAVPAHNTIAINIMASEPFWALEGERYDNWAQFLAAFTLAYDASSQTTVVIAADKQAPVEPLMQLLAALQEKSISQTQIVMQN